MNSGHFKTIFSKRLGCLVAVGEHTSSQGKANGAASGQFSGFAGTDWLSSVLQFVGVLTASCALVSLAWAGPVATAALPTGGQVAQGAAAISQSGAVMNITQSTPKAVLNWNTFDIGQNAKVNIVQPGADAVMLNRVTSANPSQILGQLNANGQVVLVNPNGILFGKDGSVNASSFTASTMGITDANFMAGNMQFERNGANAAVVNQGSIKTTGGYVALLGASVSNEGKIETQGGTAYLAAAETIKIPVSGSGRIKLELSPSSINAAVSNAKGGTIVTEGGQVYMQAAALSNAVASIIQSGSIDTTGEQGGAVHLLADGGNIKVDGSITANSTGKDEQGQQRNGGDIVIGRDEETGVLAKSTDASGAKLESTNGFVETSGNYLVVDGIQVKAKDWLLDPSDISITADATTESNNASATASGTNTMSPSVSGTATSIKASTIVSALASTNVIVETSNSGLGTGNITVNAAINAASGNTNSLTLKAYNSINITAGNGIDVKGGDLTLLANSYTGANTGNVTVSAAITGKNIFIDNTRSTSVDTSTGAIIKGASTGATGAAGINVGANITASGNLKMYGLATNNNGIYLNNATLSGGNIQAIGNSGTGSPNGFYSQYGKITTTGDSGASNVTGISATTALAGGFAAMNLKGGTYTAAVGTTLTVEGQATASAASLNTNTRGLRVDDTLNTNGTVTLKGSSSNNDGLLVQTGGINVQTGSLTLDGTSTSNGTTTASTGVTVGLAGILLSNGTSLKIIGKTANQAGAGITQTETGVQINSAIGQATGQTTAGNVTIIGSSSSYANSNGVRINSNISTGSGNINITGQRLAGGNGFAVNLNGSLSTAGNVTVQSPGGIINQASGKTIAGANITVDNTGAGLTSLIADSTGNPTVPTLAVGTSMGGSINASTGAITIGSGLDLYNTGVTLAGSSTATGNINIAGVSATTASALGGVRVAGNLTANNGAVNIYAKDTAGGANYAYYQSAGTISAGAGGVSINALGSGTNSTLDLMGTTGITSTGTVSLKGNAGTGTGNGIYTSGTVSISGASVSLEGTGGSTGGSGLYLDSTTTISGAGATGTAVSLTGTSTQAGTAGIFLKAAITGSSDITLKGDYSAGTNVSTAEVNLSGGSITGASGKAINLSGGVAGSASIVTNGASVNFSNTYTNSNPNTYSGVISNGAGTGAVSNTGGAQ